MFLRNCRWLVIALCCSLAGGAAAQAPDTAQWNAQTPAQLIEQIETKHPATYFVLAKKLFEENRKDDAAFWFYVGQIRYRAYIAANPKLDRSGDPALFSSLFNVLGPSINGYAFGDIPKLLGTIDAALAWDASKEDRFAPKSPSRDQVRAGLVKLQKEIAARRDEIRATRKQKGLENRN